MLVIGRVLRMWFEDLLALVWVSRGTNLKPMQIAASEYASS